MNNFGEQRHPDDNNFSNDRVLYIRPVDGLKPKSVTGLVDPRLFTGENNLHLVMDTENCLWGFRYERGNIPGALNTKFTSVEKALEHAKSYLRDRNLEIYKIDD